MRLIIGKIGKNETLNYALDELIRCIKLMDKTVSIDARNYDKKDDSLEGVLWLGLDGSVTPSDTVDEIKIDITNGAGVITGANNRAVLIAAYRFLYELGCRWIRPGADGEIIPKKKLEREALNVRVSETPASLHRGICIEGCVTYEHVFNVIEWLPRNGMNGYFIQFMDSFTFFRDWYEHARNPYVSAESITAEDAHHIKKRIEEEMAKRGIFYHAVGHGFHCEPFGLDCSFNDTKDVLPDPSIKRYFAYQNGGRDFHHHRMVYTNLCYTNPEVIEMISDSVFRYCRDNPQADYVVVSLGDSFNHQCECDECRKKRAADHYVNILNEADRKLTEAGLNTKIGFILYFELLWAPMQERFNNPDRFIYLLCPAERTYKKAFCDAKPCGEEELMPYEVNRMTKPSELEKILGHLFSWKKVFPGSGYIFDYHLMWEHYTDPGYYRIAKVLHRDAAGLGKMGFDGFYSCQPQRLALPTGLPMYVLAKGLWNAESDFDAECREYFSAAFGEDAQAVENYMRTLSELFEDIFERRSPIETVEKADRLIKKFMTSHILPNKDVNESWEYLFYHAELLFKYINVMRSGERVDDDEVFNAYVKVLSDYAFEIEADTVYVFDADQFVEIAIRHLKNLYNRK